MYPSVLISNLFFHTVTGLISRVVMVILILGLLFTGFSGSAELMPNNMSHFADKWRSWPFYSFFVIFRPKIVRLKCAPTFGGAFEIRRTEVNIDFIIEMGVLYVV